MSPRWGEMKDGRSWETFVLPSGVRRFKIANRGGAMICTGYLRYPCLLLPEHYYLRVDFGWAPVPDDMTETITTALRTL